MRALYWLLLCVLCGVSHAAVTPIEGWTAGGGTFGATKQEACELFLAWKNAGDWLGSPRVCRPDLGNCHRPEVGTYGSCSYCNADNPSCGSGDQTWALSPTASCPANSSDAGGGVCTCNAGFVESGGACVPESPCEANSTFTGNVVTGWDPHRTGRSTQQAAWISNFGGTHCDGACAVQVDALGGGSPFVWCGVDTAKPTVMTCDIKFRRTGASCSGSDFTSAEAATPCPPGQTLGTVNEVPRCLASGTDTSPSQQPSPRQETTTTNTVDNGDGTSTTTTTRMHSDGSTTTTVTTTDNSTGQATGSSTTTTPGGGQGTGTSGGTEQANYCRDNPDSPMCRQTSFAGTCAGGFSCQGDAVQCAIAKEQHDRNCQFYHVTDGGVEKGLDIIAGTAELPGDPRKSVTEVDLEDVLEPRPPPIGKSCPDDEEIAFQVASYPVVITIPYSSLCPYLEIAGNIMVIVTMLGCLGIIFKD